MRFNDLLRTVLANRGEGAYAVVTRWRQCVDLLAQHDVSGAPTAHPLSKEDRDEVLAIIDRVGADLTLDQRVSAIVELGSRLRSSSLVRLLAQDHPTLAAATMASAQLSDPDWAAVIPELGPLARSVLRRRANLGPQARQALDRFGPIDFALPATAVDAAPASTVDHPGAEIVDVLATPSAGENAQPSQIGRIVAQIERFTGERGYRRPAIEAEAPQAAEPGTEPIIDRFTFEADVTGTILLVSGAPRISVLGLSIGTASVDSRLGADGTALGAFRRRAAFSQARFTIGEGRLQGEWRISGEPRFDPVTGRFIGYVGLARREQAHESLVRSDAESGWSGLSAENARQLIHELRTPLNAIQGFAEMIESQLLGPVTSEYREMARSILTDASTLIATFDDLDLASRLERGDAALPVGVLDLARVIQYVARPFTAEDGDRIILDMAEALPPILGERAQAERMLSHLLRAGCAALDEGERLHLRLSVDPGAPLVRLAMRRPRALRDLSDQQLFDHGATLDLRLGAIPPLGLAFTLRLVRGIAAHLGGRFDVSADLCTILLPALQAADTEQEGRC